MFLVGGRLLGRFDVLLDKWSRMPPSEPDPFGPTATARPAMLTATTVLTLRLRACGIPSTFLLMVFLVDDPGPVERPSY